MYQNEISLVDLATVFVRRIWLFLGVFVAFITGGIVFALAQDERYEYVSLYQIAEKNADEPVEIAAKAIAVLQAQRLPELQAAYKKEHGERMPFKVSFSSPENTSLIRLSSESVRGGAERVKALHSGILDYMMSRHEIQVETVKRNLEVRLESVNRALDALLEKRDLGRAVAEMMQKQAELQRDLSSISPAESIVIGRESAERVAPNRKVIVVLATVLGFIVAFVSVFFAEFVSLVREALRK
ncbi:lipopolysaccharide biosynthesis protein [Marinobacter daepoensis]|uniref:Wzz/FepE/Etk N-terminal domain-containing protein n=1 Tax=Marinobacter daepoensis TaxID=262077 RepID=UPI001C948EE8|nr:Wzz/FepE/Etk N-terminal domain-containing protein [Marinobacter daepoensis]MBY6033629.1 lipopolysaccharide biosynthesis protein [Marinobacter daepoensis]